jgi:GNAT superfamily N-acetyltransferase
VEYARELDRRFDIGFDPSQSLPVPEEEMRPPDGAFLIASLQGDPVACGAVKLHGDEPAELKRVWVAPAVRRIGLGRRMLEALEGWAAAQGAPAIRLDTNRSLTEAITLYRSAGYREVDAFNDEPYAHHWFEKPLGDQEAG